MVNLFLINVKEDCDRFSQYPLSYRLVFAAILAIVAAILQSMGGYLPGIGFLLSPLSTLPILVAIVYAEGYGILAYFLTIILLVLIQPAELFIFPFTTGLLGLVLGFTLKFFKSRVIVILVSTIVLMAGICIPLYVLGFPLLGPMGLNGPNLRVLLPLFVFCLLYCFAWLLLALLVLKKMNRLLVRIQ